MKLRVKKTVERLSDSFIFCIVESRRKGGRERKEKSD